MSDNSFNANNNAPILVYAKCLECCSKWNAFCSDGLEPFTFLECVNDECGAMRGVMITQEEYERDERS